nr:FAD/NAD(P)-binding domain-containing protein [Rhodopirellula sp. SM50]
MSSVLDVRTTSNDNVIPEQATGTLRLAIIGCGPRGLQCLEALSRNLSPAALANIEISVYEPCRTLGAGCVYDPRQPHVLRMNFASQHVDFWKTDSGSVTHPSTSLIGWLVDHYPAFASNDQYVPRAIVGEYLNECYAVVEEKLRGARSYEVISSRVSGIRKRRSGWEVTSGDKTKLVDVVVLTTGHEGLRRSNTLEQNESARFVFPVQENLSEQCVLPGSRVLVRGFGLTALDAVLAMTEGRGGSLVQTGRTVEYRASGREPKTITVYSRTGRPMLAKPTAAIEQLSDHFWGPFREQLKAITPDPSTVNFYKDVFSIIQRAAAELLVQHGNSVTEKDVADWYRGWSRYRMDARSAYKAMRRSVMVSTGQRPRNIAYALGESWRKLYPEIVTVVSHGGLNSLQWPKYQRVAVEMERIAFGPPADSLRRLLSLIKAGIVELTNQDDDLDATPFDSHIDAVIAAPNQISPNGPLASLLADGWVVRDETTGAIKVDTAGEAINSRSEERPGLYLFGRATEGWVVGNDSLSRTLHGHIEKWSKSLVLRPR